METQLEFSHKGEKAAAVRQVKTEDLETFGNMYCSILNPVYQQFRPLPPIRFGAFVCCPFCYGETPDLEMPAADEVVPFLEKLLHKQTGARLFVNRILRLYEQNVVLIVKPDQKRYWLRSIAMRDADATLADLLEQGY